MIDFKTRKVTRIESVDPPVQMESWEYRKCRWNPWSRDGSRLAFLRDGQVWTCRPGRAASGCGSCTRSAPQRPQAVRPWKR